MKLAFDLHGVIINLMPQMQRWFIENRGFDPKGTEEAKSRFDFSLPEGYDPRQVGIDIARSINAYEHDAEEMPGSIKALRNFYAKGYEILIVTAAAPSTMQANIDWLNAHLKRPYVIDRVDTSIGKLAKLQELGVTHYVDDRFRTCNELSDHLDFIYLYNAKCNMGREIQKPNVLRVFDLKEVIRHFVKK